MREIERRIENLESKLSPGYKGVEGILRQICLEKQKSRTPEEQSELAALAEMKVDPRLESTIARIATNRGQILAEV